MRSQLGANRRCQAGKDMYSIVGTISVTDGRDDLNARSYEEDRREQRIKVALALKHGLGMEQPTGRPCGGDNLATTEDQDPYGQGIVSNH